MMMMVVVVVAKECKLLKTHAKENCVGDDDAIECAIFSETHVQKESCGIIIIIIIIITACFLFCMCFRTFFCAMTTADV
jgi:hypothetical protein